METPKKEGYIFCGYYDNPFFEGKPVDYETPYPMFKLIFYKIKYILNGGTNNKYNIKKYNINSEILLTAPIRQYYRFVGWFDLSGVKVSEIKKGTTGDITLEAKWIHESIYYDAGKIESSEEPFFDNDNDKKDYLLKMYKTELDFFTLFESKNSSLVTADTILLTLASVFTSQIFEGNITSTKNIIVAEILCFILIALISCSLAITLWNVIFDVGKRRKRIIKINYNHHSISGIIRYNQTEFIEKIDSISAKNLTNDLAKQVYGLVKINNKSQKRIRVAVIFDLVALVYFLIVLVVMFCI